MSRRYYLAPIIGDGTDGNPYRAKVTNYGVNHSAVIPTDELGVPLRTWCLAVVQAADHSTVLADGTIDALPDEAWPTVLSVGQKAAVALDLQAQGATLGEATTITTVTTMGDLVNSIGQFFEAAFLKEALSVSE